MTTLNGFIRAFARADGAQSRKALTRLYHQLSALADGDALPEEPDMFLHDLMLDMDRTEPDLDPAGLRCVIDRAFRDVDLEQGSFEQAFLLRKINQILTGRIAFDRPSWCYHVIGPSQGRDTYDKISARGRALDLQKAFRLPCQAATSREDILKSRGVLLEGPASGPEILLAGIALERGLEVIGIGIDPEELDILSYPDAGDAFRELVARSTGRHAEMTELDLDLQDSELPPALSPDAERAAWQLRAEIIEQAYVALRRAATFSSDRNAGRAAELDKLMREEGTPEDIRKAYFDIVANGSRPGSSPVAAQKINGMRHRIEALERRIEALTSDDDPEP